jgi:hypothetical protein
MVVKIIKQTTKNDWEEIIKIALLLVKLQNCNILYSFVSFFSNQLQYLFKTLTVNASKNAGGKCSSIEPMSLENLFRIRPEK